MAGVPDYLAAIEHESARAAAKISFSNLRRRVPSCPEWDLFELLSHLGRVQRFWAEVIRAGSVEEPEFDDPDSPSERVELATWFRASTDDLLAALRAVPAGAPAWTWWGEPRTAGAIARHQAQEAAVHRWDSQLALGSPDPIDAALAADAVDEYVGNMEKLDLTAGLRAVELSASDTNESWRAAAHGEPAAVVSAPASDLILLLYGRIPLDDVTVEGDRVAAQALLDAAVTE